MTATIHLINAIILIIFGLWGYFVGGSVTAFIPVFFGIILGILYPGVKNKSFIPSHIAVVLTLLVLIALVIKPLPAALESENLGRIFRTLIMVFTSLSAMIAFIKSFIHARKKKSSI